MISSSGHGDREGSTCSPYVLRKALSVPQEEAGCPLLPVKSTRVSTGVSMSQMSQPERDPLEKV